MITQTLQELQTTLKHYILGQDELCNVLSTTLFKHKLKKYGRDLGQYFHGSTSLLLIGESGSGKTHAVRTLSELVDIPYFEINCKTISQEGWAGQSFKQLMQMAIYNREMETGTIVVGGIIFLDEFDKILGNNVSSGGDDANYHIQTSLLKYIEGMEIETKSGRFVDTSNFLFVLAGAFVDLDIKDKTITGFNNEEKNTKTLLTALQDYGMLPEIAGRINERCILNKITSEVYMELLENEEFILKKWEVVLNKLDIQLQVIKEDLIQQAVKSGLGVRGLIQAIEAEVTKTINNHVQEVDLDKFSPLYTKAQDEQTLQELLQRRQL